MIAAALGETTCCIVRVPFEVIKQRAQANRHLKAREILYHTVKTEGTIGLYRGYVSTITREIPFSFIQYPIWEYLKGKWGEFQGESIDPWQGAVCGAIAGCIAAGTTTPLDVVKTRVMLAQVYD
jgi:solute carrier family 25 S-adenosylmethionine transporter 26